MSNLKTIVCMATIPERAQQLKKAVKSILPQVDALKVYLNGWDNIPAFLVDSKVEVVRSQYHGDQKVLSRWHWFRRGELTNCYVMMVDDDIIYPPDYVESITGKVEEYERKAIVSYHGHLYRAPITSYHNSIKRLYFNQNVKRDYKVDSIGVGVCGFYSETLQWQDVKLEMELDFRKMNDVHISYMATAQDIDLICLAHPAHWIKKQRTTTSVFRDAKADHSPHTYLAQQIYKLRHDRRGDAGRHLCVIANTAVEKELELFVKTARIHGWMEPVYVYYPEDEPPKLRKGCIGRPWAAWWKVPGSKVNTFNAPALLKAELLMDFPDGDQVVYMDCADIVLCCNPARIFADHKERGIYARNYAKKKLHMSGDIIDKLNLNPKYCGVADSFNNGVIVVNQSPKIREWLQKWDDLLKLYPETGPWLRFEKRKIGDQQSFNYIFRQMLESGDAGYLPKKYNYNTAKKVNQLRVKKGKLKTDSGDVVFVPHASGMTEMSRHVIEYALGNYEEYKPKKIHSFEKILSRCLRRCEAKNILEWGPGRSTEIMIAQCPGAKIKSIEHDKRWFREARRKFKKNKNVDLIYSEIGQETHYAYIGMGDKYDLIFIDGIRRVECAFVAMQCIKDEGFILLHDSCRKSYIDMIQPFIKVIRDK